MVRTEFKVLGVVLLVLLAGEGVLRIVEESLSLDLKHIRAIPEIAAELAEQDACRILFLGNSLTQRGVVPDVFEAVLEEEGGVDVEVGHVYPDDTHIVEWYYAFDRYFVDSERAPDVLVVGFALDQVQDQPLSPIHTARIARSYSRLQDVPEIFRQDLHGLGERIELLFAKGFVSFASRERVERRVLDTVVPNYRASAHWVNSAYKDTDRLESPTVEEEAPSYGRLRRLVAAAAEHGTEVVVVAMPIQEEYHPDQALARTLEEVDAHFIDAREIEGITHVDFLDTHHLDPAGAERYSRFVAQSLTLVAPSLCDS